ncbi:MAG: response regulator transcription factor [Sulfuricurvum sp.]
MKILLLEDDPVLGETLEEMLSDAGYETLWVTDGAGAAETSFEQRFDLYVFDVNVPEINGFDLLESLRDADDPTPAIFISALTDLSSITKGFQSGADDYLKKPFYPEELLLRIQAKFAHKNLPIAYQDLTFDPKTREIRREGKLITLGELQLPFFELLLTHIGQTIPKERFLDAMEHPSDSGVRVAINKLKHATGLEIQNVRGIGYRIEKSRT